MEDALADCLDALAQGEESLERRLKRYPAHREELIPLLQLARRTLFARPDFKPPPGPTEDLHAYLSRPPKVVSRGSRALHSMARRHPTLVGLALFVLFSALSALAWLSTLGAIMVVAELSLPLAKPLLLAGLTLLPLFFLWNLFRSVRSWLRLLVFSPALPSRGKRAPASASGNLIVASVRAGWNSEDAAVRLWYRVTAWSALRVIALIMLFGWALPLVTASGR